MSRIERFSDLSGNWQDFIQDNRPSGDTICQRLTFNQFHHDEVFVAGFFEAVEVAMPG